MTRSCVRFTCTMPAPVRGAYDLTTGERHAKNVTWLNKTFALENGRGPKASAGALCGDLLALASGCGHFSNLVKTHGWSWSIQLKIGDLIRIPGQ